MLPCFTGRSATGAQTPMPDAGDTYYSMCEETRTGDTGGCQGLGGLKTGRPSESTTGETALRSNGLQINQRQMSDEE